jgi:hypothetical protein
MSFIKRHRKPSARSSQPAKMWLTNAAYMNDPNELTYPLQLLQKVLDVPAPEDSHFCLTP